MTQDKIWEGQRRERSRDKSAEALGSTADEGLGREGQTEAQGVRWDFWKSSHGAHPSLCLLVLHSSLYFPFLPPFPSSLSFLPSAIYCAPASPPNGGAPSLTQSCTVGVRSLGSQEDLWACFAMGTVLRREVGKGSLVTEAWGVRVLLVQILSLHSSSYFLF